LADKHNCVFKGVGVLFFHVKEKTANLENEATLYKFYYMKLLFSVNENYISPASISFSKLKEGYIQNKERKTTLSYPYQRTSLLSTQYQNMDNSISQPRDLSTK
jgi:hypothetical protein